MTWDPGQYLAFADRRTRPALELLARVTATDPAVVVDLGCGPGHLTRRLHERWPAAELVAVDASAAMLERARTDHGDLPVRWVHADVAAWAPDGPVDVVYSNAVLHWLDDHATLFPRLVDWLRAGGELAVQMPRNHDEPSHTAAVAVARGGPWRDRLEPVLREHPVAPPEVAWDLLAPHVTGLDVWETVYLQPMADADAVAAWTRGSMLRPLLDALEPDEADRFEAAYRVRLREAYPPRPDGTVLFPFRRQFLVATR